MSKLIKKFLALAIVVAFSACSGAAPSAGPGIVSWAQDGIIATKESAKKPTKIGKACSKNILGLVSSGDISVEKAKSNGDINVVTSIDREIRGFNYYIPWFGYSCTIVQGY
jgi:hypothetical protein